MYPLSPGASLALLLAALGAEGAFAPRSGPQDSQDSQGDARPVLVEINGLKDLGLAGRWRQEGPRARGEVALLVNPRWRTRGQASGFLQRAFLLPGEEPGSESEGVRGFNPAEIAQLEGEEGYQSTLIWRKVRDVGAAFLEAIFDRQPKLHDSLADLVARESFSTMPVVVFDPVFRLRRKGARTWMDVHLSVRLFLLEVAVSEGSARGSRWVRRCEMIFEDRSLGSAPLDAPQVNSSLDKAVRACLIDALRGRIALSLVANNPVRRELLSARADLLGASLSEVGERRGGIQ